MSIGNHRKSENIFANIYSEVDVRRILIEIKSFATKKFGSLRQMSIAFGMAPNAMHYYFNQMKVPSMKIIAKMEEYGLDVKELLSNKQTTLASEPMASYVAKEMTIEYHIGAIWQGYADILPGTPTWSALDDETRRRVVFEMSKKIIEEMAK